MAVGSVAALSAGALSGLTRMSPWLLAVAAVLHVAKMTAEARAWHGIVRPAHRGAPIPFRTTLGAFMGAIGANAVLPARVGEAFRLGIVRRYAPGASLAAIGGTVVLETLLEMGFAALVLGIVLGAGRSIGLLGNPVHAIGTHPTLLPATGALLASGAVLALVFRRRLAPLVRELARGFAVLRHPHAFGRVLGWKMVAWSLRTGTIAAFLLAFGLPATFWTVALVLAAQNAAAVLPLTPGNAGTQQAALVVALAGTASASTALGFGIGMQAATIVVDLTLGVVAVAAVAGRREMGVALGALRRRVPATG